MEAQVKRYNVVIRGRVQDIGFRDLIAQMANFLRLRGYVFNDADGSVKVIIEGVKETLDSFLEDIRIKTSSIGAEIEGLDKREVPFDSDLPPRFVKIPTTELEEIGRKLDIGIGKLGSMDGKLGSVDGRLGSMDGKLGSMDDRLGSMDGKLGSMDDRLGSMDGKLGSMDERLGSMDGKLGSMDDRLGSMDGKLDKLDKLDTLDILVEGQGRMSEAQEKTVKVLEKIASKLS